MFETYAARGPMYDEAMIRPMRDELVRAGFSELKTAEAVDRALAAPGPVLAVVNSVCGCAAGVARPGIVAAVDRIAPPAGSLVTVFAGQDKEATARLREKLAAFPPSSPSAAIFRGGEPVFFLSRREIEGRTPDAIAGALENAWNAHAGAEAAP